MVERIPPAEAKRRMDEDEWVYVDVRSIPEFEQGHPSGAYNVPLMHMGAGGMEPNADFLSVMEASFPKDAKLVLGCKSGGRSLRAAEMLEAAGWTSVVDQRAGWGGSRNPFGQVGEAGWEAAGLPTSTEAPPGRAYEDLKKKRG
ncbi:MAG TPA: rhodanese-like domain-containing protein [Sandaracinaceae bacterium LLY-WYZ-13_1]|nr:rhodanese-like domain-containing protein [Sandaracinaceae bacterium LLY-WYZ-13_1]